MLLRGDVDDEVSFTNRDYIACEEFKGLCDFHKCTKPNSKILKIVISRLKEDHEESLIVLLIKVSRSGSRHILKDEL